jgi:hypothetical protein
MKSKEIRTSIRREVGMNFEAIGGFLNSKRFVEKKNNALQTYIVLCVCDSRI